MTDRFAKTRENFRVVGNLVALAGLIVGTVGLEWRIVIMDVTTSGKVIATAGIMLIWAVIIIGTGESLKE